MKRILSLILTLILVLSTFTPAFGAPSDKELYNESGEILKNIGILQGSETGDLMLDRNLKRQDMVVLISRLYKQENTAKKYSIKSTFSDVKDSFYKPYISWAVDQGLIIGMGNNEFGFSDPVTVQQFQTLLLRVLKYNEEAKDWANVPEIAKRFKLMEGLSATPKQNVDRGLMAAMTVNALRLQMKGESITLAQHLNLNIPDPFKVDEIAKVNGNTLKLEGVAKGVKSLKVNLKPVSDNINSEEKTVDVNLKEDGRFSVEIPNLQSGKYEYKFVSGGRSTKAKSITIEALAFQLRNIAASNLKEIALSFTTPVDKLGNLFSGNYSTNAGSVKSVRLEDNDTKIILTLNETMKNNRDYKLSANRIVSDRGQEIKVKDEKFTTLDDEIPRVEEIKQLGDKGLRVYMTEPVKSARASNFKIDDKKFSGNVNLLDNVITLSYYSSSFAPKEGVHTLTVSGLEDYAGHEGIEEDISFDIIEDTKAPKIVDARATVEEVIIEFDEEIYPDSISRTSFYWKSGSRKRYPSKVKVLNDKVILDYSGNTLPTYEIAIYVDNVEDYSGNKLRDEVEVEPTVDRVNPEVVGTEVSEDGKSITVYYSKNVEAKNRAYYSIKDKNNKTINIRSIEGSGREYRINLNAPLPIGVNTLTIQDVRDTTSSKNKLITFTQEIDMDDVEKPKIVSHSGKDREIMLLFSKEMDPTTITNYENYIINFDGKRDYLPKDTEFELIYDDKAWIIELPEKIDGQKVDIGRYGNIREIEISGLRADNGVLIAPTTLAFDGSNQGEAKAIKAELIESDTIKVEFDQPILSADPDDFSLSDRRIYDVIVDGSTEINLILNRRDETGIDNDLNIRRSNSIETILEAGVKSGYISIVDKVPPTIEPDIDTLRLNKYTIELPFTEKLEKEVASLFKKDLIIEAYGEKILDQSDFSTELDSTGSTILIKVDSSIKAPDGYIVRLVDHPKYIMDKDGNVVEPSFYDYFTR